MAAVPESATIVNALRSGCVAMCSTEPGAYGSPDRGTEVPRAPLLAALAKKTNQQLVRSDQIPVGNTPATAGLEAVPAIFKAPAGQLFIDYEF